MEQLDAGSLRYHVLENAKDFKRSWIELGRSLYAVWKDKLYKEWGYSAFDIYVAREIGIRKQTAMKLLKSYYFLEKEEPEYLKPEYAQASEPARLPGYESIDVLRRAKANRSLDEEAYGNLKKEVFEEGRDAQQVKKELTSIIRQRQELAPQQAYEKRKATTLRRLLGSLKSIGQEARVLKLLSVPLLKELDALAKRIEEEIESGHEPG